WGPPCGAIATGIAPTSTSMSTTTTASTEPTSTTTTGTTIPSIDEGSPTGTRAFRIATGRTKAEMPRPGTPFAAVPTKGGRRSQRVRPMVSRATRLREHATERATAWAAAKKWARETGASAATMPEAAATETILRSVA
ncbi:MAG TPA: hypothetical protein EYG06_10380, partial [Myxococcales bacterium]|nr:hypothetical protein [Myxococcales bacterium]